MPLRKIRATISKNVPVHRHPAGRPAETDLKQKGSIMTNHFYTNASNDVQSTNKLQSISADIRHVKYLGRTLSYDGILWLALSGSGIEFLFQGSLLSLLLAGDDSAGTQTQEEKARFAVFLDGIRVIDELMTQPETRYTLIDNETPITCHVRIVKLSEAPMSILGIKELTADENASCTPAVKRNRKIEFIGDSITCGYGIDDDDPAHPFATGTEDALKAYAALTAEALHADYSLVSYSGHGVISGYTQSNEKNTDALLPPFYPLVGFSHGTYQTRSVTGALWDFNDFSPDLIVINLGTNDDSYCQDIKERQEEFALSYRQFLEEIRARNPEAVILCTYGLMNERLHPYLDKAVASFRKQNHDEKIDVLHFPMQTDADGYVVNYHPCMMTHQKAAWLLTQKIKTLMNW